MIHPLQPNQQEPIVKTLSSNQLARVRVVCGAFAPLNEQVVSAVVWKRKNIDLVSTLRNKTARLKLETEYLLLMCRVQT